MSSLTRESIQQLMQKHGLRFGYELKIMGKENQITGVQFAKRSFAGASMNGLPEKRSIKNDSDAISRLEKELLITFGQRNRKDAANRILNTFKSATERYMLPSGTQVDIANMESATPTLTINQGGREIASLDIGRWDAFSRLDDPKDYSAKYAMLEMAKKHGELLRRVGSKNSREFIESSINRFVLSENDSVEIKRDHGSHHAVTVPGVDEPIKTYDPEFEAKFEQAMLAAGTEKHAVEMSFTLNLDWSDTSDEDGYSFEPNIMEDDAVDEMIEGIRLEVSYALAGDGGDVSDEALLPHIDVRVLPSGEAIIDDSDNDEYFRRSLRHKTVNDMPLASEDVSVQILMPPEMPVSTYSLELIKEAVGEWLSDNYSLLSDTLESEVKPSSHGLPLRGLRNELEKSFDQALEQYAMLEPSQKSIKMAEVVRDVLGYTAPIEEELMSTLRSENVTGEKLVSAVEVTMEERLLKDAYPMASPEVSQAIDKPHHDDPGYKPSIGNRR